METSMKRIVVIGGGFAGLWSAAGAVRKLDELGIGPEQVEVVLINRDAYHGIRVRYYEQDLSQVRAPLDQVLEPIGVRRIEGRVVDISIGSREIKVAADHGSQRLAYDRLVLAAGSQLCRPATPGLAEHAFSVDNYADAVRLDSHLRQLANLGDESGRYTAVVVGAGLTGIEAACELPERLRQAAGRSDAPVRVILADHAAQLGSNMGEHALPVIQTALSQLGIEQRPGVDIAQFDARGVTLASGERIAAATVLWTAGMKASPLTEPFPVSRDRFGRLPVDECMKVKGLENVFAAGDVAWALIDGKHPSVMSCQHGRPMGRYAGHNVVCDLFGLPQLPLIIQQYVTILDLGPWGALYTEGWDRVVKVQGPEAKRTKQTINCVRIYPPLTGDRRAILDAAAPVVQAAPAVLAE